MKGLYFGINGGYLEKAEHEASEFSLLARGGGSEVVMQTIVQGKAFYVYPGEEPDALEFFYLLEGECVYEEADEKKVLKQGDYFYINNLEDSAYFKAFTDLKLLWFTNQPTYHHLSESIFELTKVVKQIEEKDQYTYHHSARVQEIALGMAKELQVSRNQLDNLYFASLFHDIGKINVPEEILNKPDRLTTEEFLLLKKHCENGCEMVQSTYYSQLGEIILQHHERLDGSGYPYGLKGEQILFEAQIIGLADTFDAMTSDRIYRKGMDKERAMSEIKKLANIHFSSEIIDALERFIEVDKTIAIKELKDKIPK